MTVAFVAVLLDDLLAHPTSGLVDVAEVHRGSEADVPYREGCAGLGVRPSDPRVDPLLFVVGKDVGRVGLAGGDGLHKGAEADVRSASSGVEVGGANP